MLQSTGLRISHGVYLMEGVTDHCQEHPSQTLIINERNQSLELSAVKVKWHKFPVNTAAASRVYENIESDFFIYNFCSLLN